MENLSKILLVDDVPLFLELEQSFLKGLGTEVLTAGDGIEAIRIAREQQPDVIIMDLVMPRMNGDEACRQLKGDPHTKAIPIILVTAQGGEKTHEQCKRAGCNAVLFKPLKRNELLGEINRVLSVSHHGPISEKRRVLVIEQSRFYASLLQDVLNAKGYDAQIALNEVDANEQFRSGAPDLILLDLLLTSVDPFKLLSRIRDDAELRESAVAALTSLAPGDPTAQKAQRMGVTEFINKTTTPTDIGYRVDEILFARSANTRRAPRHAVRAPIEYKKGRFWILGEVANVSATGMYVKAMELPELDARILIRFAFPHQKEPCEEEADVVWVQSPQGSGVKGSWGIESGFGLRLVSPSKAFLKNFEEFVARQGQ